MNTDKTFLVVSRARLINKASPDHVITELQNTFRLSFKAAETLVNSERIIKAGLSIEQAKKYKMALQKCGLVGEILEEGSPEHNIFAHALKSKNDQKEIERALGGDVIAFNTSGAYQAGLILSALLALVSPTLYVSLIAGLCYLTFWFAGNILTWELVSSSAAMYQIWGYGCVLFVLSVVTLFLARPLFVKSQRQTDRLILNKKNNPTFYLLVERLCQKFNQPMPKTIYISNDVNAYVAPEKGLASLLKKELTLTVGAPLIATFNKRQLVGVLSHEFGHFNQRSAMLAHYTINTVSSWLASRVWHKDRLDLKLEAGSEREDSLSIAAMLAQFCIGCARRVLKLFYYLNHFISQKMSRQMEYDADKYESVISGSRCFEGTSIALRKAGLGDYYAHALNKKLWNTNHLLVDLSEATANETLDLGRNDLARIKEEMSVKQTNWWDSHPADYDRVEHAKALNMKGLWRYEGSARELFGDFQTLSRKLTLQEYKARGFYEGDFTLIEYSEAIARQQEEHKEQQALEEFQMGMASYRCFYVADAVKPKANIHSIKQELIQRKTAWEQAENDYWNGRSQASEAILAKLYLGAGLAVPKFLTKSYKTSDDCNDEIAAKSKQWEAARTAFKEIDGLICQRIALAMRVVSEDVRHQLTQQLKLFKLLERTESFWLDLRRNHWILENLLEASEYHGKEFTPLIPRYSKFLHEDLSNFVRAASDYNVCLNHQPTRKFSWWFEEWAGSYNPSENYSPEDILEIVDGCNRLIFFLISKLSSSVAVHCLEAEKVLLSTVNKEPEPA